MSSLDFPSPNASITTEEVEELIYSRHQGEDAPHFYARITRMACSRWLLTSEYLEWAKVKGLGGARLAAFEEAERKAKSTMTTYALMLVEALTEKAA